MIVLDPSIFIQSSPFVKTYSLKEFFELPEPKDNSKMELIQGVLYMSPMPDWRHSETIENIDSFLREKIRSLKLGGQVFRPRAGIMIDQHTWLEPDLFYLSFESLKKWKGEHPRTADLIVEVLSLSTEKYDTTTKADTYEALNVTELWLIDSIRKTIEVRKNKNGKWNSIVVYERNDVFHSDVLPNIDFYVNKFL